MDEVVELKRRSLVIREGSLEIWYTKIGKVGTIDTYTEVITEVTEGGISVDSNILSCKELIEKLTNVIKDEVDFNNAKTILKYIASI